MRKEGYKAEDLPGDPALGTNTMPVCPYTNQSLDESCPWSVKELQDASPLKGLSCGLS